MNDMAAASIHEWTNSACEAIASLVTDRTGLCFPDNRRPEAESAIRFVAQQAGCDSLDDFRRAIVSGAIPIDQLVAELVVSESYFFREPDHFRFVRECVLPQCRRDTGALRQPRIWSAGCAGGEEAFSLGILLVEAGYTEEPAVLGTDLSARALERARMARYSAWSLRDLSVEQVDRYFHRTAGGFKLRARYRRSVTFQQLNLADDTFPSYSSGIWGMDLIFCRNVLIYLDRRTVSALARRLFAALADNGWVILGSSDPQLADHAPFELVRTPFGVFYRRRPRTAGWSSSWVTAPSPMAAESDIGDESTPSVEGPMVPITSTDGIPARRQTAPPAPASSNAGHRVRDLADRGHLIEARAELIKALRWNPASGELHYLHAVISLALGHLRDAERAVRKALYLDRLQPATHALQATILDRLGKVQEANRAHRTASALLNAAPPTDAVSANREGTASSRRSNADPVRRVRSDHRSKG